MPAPSPPEGSSAPVAVVLLQLGGPASLDEVQPFLENMFRDPELFNLPIPARAQDWLAEHAAKWRAKRARPLYAAIGGRSPIGDITARQAHLLERELNHSMRSRVFVAMRYGKPSTEEAVEKVLAADCRSVTLLPLYPQYSTATTGSSVREWQRCAARKQLNLPTATIDSYPSHPAYISAVSGRVSVALARLPAESDPHVLFSAHGLPQKFVRQGDPYQSQIEETVQEVARECALQAPYTLCYQSRIGPQRWLKPSLTETLRRLGRSGCQAVLVVPISFVSDHLETLSEINVEAREQAMSLGIRHFETATGLNDSPAFIQALAELVLATADGS
ncbi:MAG: ferrochelatase [Bryobacterales bacterium]|nr:ferrochelatase [Bryobacterales bacterium]